MEMKHLKGIYLVVDPKDGFDALQPKLEAAIAGGVKIIQVWDHWGSDQDKELFIRQLIGLAGDVPVIINNDLGLAQLPGVWGVHLDRPEDLDQLIVRDQLLVGVTLSGPADWAGLKSQGVDYISFCSMFPSSSTDACELVSFDTVREACLHFPGSVFAAGGINRENAGQIVGLGVSGLALISGIMSAPDPRGEAQYFNQLLEKQ